ncbi:MAG: hypothetical protein IPH97_11190 [Ignavibacteriales bacterium]|nr:hypothetical protein [Ignavibacteriales bacterium]
MSFAWNNEVKISNINATEISNIIVSGLGGSAISADLMRNFLGEELRVPYIVNRNYDLPKFANKKHFVCRFILFRLYRRNNFSITAGIKLGCKIVCITNWW